MAYPPYIMMDNMYLDVEINIDEDDGKKEKLKKT